MDADKLRMTAQALRKLMSQLPEKPAEPAVKVAEDRLDSQKVLSFLRFYAR